MVLICSVFHMQNLIRLWKEGPQGLPLPPPLPWSWPYEKVSSLLTQCRTPAEGAWWWERPLAGGRLWHTHVTREPVPEGRTRVFG